MHRCLFELYHALIADVKVIMQLGPEDEREFRLAVEKGGMVRVQAALNALDAHHAEASVEEDRLMILEDIEKTVGLQKFNQQVRGGLLSEFQLISIDFLAH